MTSDATHAGLTIRQRKMLISLGWAVVSCGLLYGYAVLSDYHPVLPIKILVAPAFIVGAIFSGNVHQPSAIGAWLVFLLYAWLIIYGMWTLVAKLGRHTVPNQSPQPPRPTGG